MMTTPLQALPATTSTVEHGRTIAWLLLCLWCAWWTWHLVWWIAPPGALSRANLIMALAIGSMPVVLLAATITEWRLALAPFSLLWRAIAWHCLASFLLGALLASMLRNGLGFVGLCLLFGAIVDLPALLLVGLLRTSSAGDHPAFRPASLLMATAGIAMLLGLWSAATAGIVTAQARRLAGTDPYCLQVNDEFGYAVVNHWTDLSGFRITAPWRSAGMSLASGESQWTYHAVLMVERDGQIGAYNWSHWAQAFVPLPHEHPRFGGYISRQEVTIFCTPTPSYLDHLGEHQRAAGPLLHYPPWPYGSGEFLHPLSGPPARPPEAAEPIVPAASWQQAYWSHYLVRYQSMEALIVVCALDVDVSTRARIADGAMKAWKALEMNAAAARESGAAIAETTQRRAALYCDPSSLFHRDLVASFPGETPAGQR